MSPAPPPYPDDVCKCGHGNPPLARAGRYRGLCGIGKAEAVGASRLRRGTLAPATTSRSEIEDDARVAARQPQLAATVRDLVPAAVKLERAVAARRLSTAHARTALGEFKEGLQMVARVAQSLVNQHMPVAKE